VDGDDRHRGVEAVVVERRSSAFACTTGADPGGRWVIITPEGSTTVTSRPPGS